MLWWMGLLLEVLSAPWWELSARLFASQEQPSPVGLIQAQGLEQRATRALLSALRVLRALKPGVCLALRVDPTAWLVQLWWLRVPWRQERQPQLVRWLREQSLQEMLSRALWLWERVQDVRPACHETSMEFSLRAGRRRPVRDGRWFSRRRYECPDC